MMYRSWAARSLAYLDTERIGKVKEKWLISKGRILLSF